MSVKQTWQNSTSNQKRIFISGIALQTVIFFITFWLKVPSWAYPIILMTITFGFYIHNHVVMNAVNNSQNGEDTK